MTQLKTSEENKSKRHKKCF